MANEEPGSGLHGAEAGRVSSGEAVNRQLRRRYESLREDYDELLDRLGEVEGRLRRAEEPRSELPGRTTLATAIAEAISAPLFALRDGYAEAARELGELARSVEELGWRTFKGQRTGNERPAAPVERGEESPPPSGPVTADVRVDRADLGMLLDFQEQVANLPNVARVSLSQIHEDRAVLTVELRATT